MSSRKASPIKNYIYNISYKVLTLLIPLITAPYLARVIGAEGTGTFAYIYSISHFFMLVAKLGVMNYGTREIAKVRDNKEELKRVFNEIYRVQILVASLVTLVYYGFVAAFAHNDVILYAVNGVYVLSIILDIDWLYYGLENIKAMTIRNTAIKILTVVLIIMFVKTREDLLLYFVIMAASELLKFLSLWLGVGRITGFSKVNTRKCFYHLKPILILFFPVIATSIYRSMDKVMLGYMTNMVETGIYENTEKIIYVLLGFISSLENVMMPRLSNLFSVGRNKEARENIYYSLVFVTWLSCALAFGISGISHRFIPLFYGEEFLGVINLMTPLATSLIYIAWADVIRTQYLVPKGYDNSYVISTVAGAVINLIINALLIPPLGAMGAVIGTLCAEFSVTIYVSYIARKEIPIFGTIKDVLAFIGIGVAMMFAVEYVGKIVESTVAAIVIQIIVGAVMYILLSAVYVRKFLPNIYNLVLRKVKHRK